MADGYKLWKACPTCKGAGVQALPNNTGVLVDRTCPECLGQKYFLWGWCSVDTFTLPDVPE